MAAEITARGARAVARFGLDSRSLAVLMAVAAAGPLNQRDLGVRLGIDRTTMVAVVDELEAAGRVQRHRLPPDRRANQIGITDSGQEVLDAADEALQHCEDEFVAGLTLREQASLARLLHKLPHRDLTAPDKPN